MLHRTNATVLFLLKKMSIKKSRQNLEGVSGGEKTAGRISRRQACGIQKKRTLILIVIVVVIIIIKIHAKTEIFNMKAV